MMRTQPVDMLSGSRRKDMQARYKDLSRCSGHADAFVIVSWALARWGDTFRALSLGRKVTILCRAAPASLRPELKGTNSLGLASIFARNHDSVCVTRVETSPCACKLRVVFNGPLTEL